MQSLRNNIKCKEYDCKRLKYFKYVYDDKEGNRQWEVNYSKKNSSKAWEAQFVLDNQVYRFMYEVPKADASIELIAAIGLKHLQFYLKQEIELKMSIDFEISEVADSIIG